MSKEAFSQIMSEAAPEAKATPAQTRAVENTQEKPATEKSSGLWIGEGHAMAMLRLGGHELTQALQAFPDSNIRVLEEPGVFGNENAPQKPAKESDTPNLSAAKDGQDDTKEPVKSGIEPVKDVSLKDILDAPAPTTPAPPSVEHDMGREM